MKIEKLNTNSYRVRKMYKGKQYSLVFDHKPTQKEVAIELAEAMTVIKDVACSLTVTGAIDKYIENGKNILAPSTIKGYRSCQRNMPEELANTELIEIDNDLLQKYVSQILEKHSVKYCKNIMGLVRGVLASYRPNFVFKVKYPTVTKTDQNEAYMPTSEDVSKIIKAAEGTEFEIPLMLAASCGLRRGEICALTIDDLSDDNYLTINKDMVQDEHNNWIVKPPKTKTSVRKLYVQPFIADKIREKGYIYKGYPNSIYDWLQNAQNKLGIPNFTLHKLRHFFCSSLSAANIDEATILKLGGWSDPSVMKRVYRHSTADNEKIQGASKIASSWHETENKTITAKELIKILKNEPGKTFDIVGDKVVISL